MQLVLSGAFVSQLGCKSQAFGNEQAVFTEGLSRVVVCKGSIGVLLAKSHVFL